MEWPLQELAVFTTLEQELVASQKWLNKIMTPLALAYCPGDSKGGIQADHTLVFLIGLNDLENTFQKSTV